MANENITFLHLSDFHLKSTRYAKRKQSSLLNILLTDIKTFLIENNLKINFVIITGDLSYSGEDKQFIEFEKFLDSLCQKINIEINDIFPVPGNHDIFIENISECAKNYNIKKIFFNEDKIDEVFESINDKKSFFFPLNNYFKFFNKNFKHINRLNYNKICFNKLIKINNNNNVRIIGYNTPWFTFGQKNEENLIIGKKQLLDGVNNLSKKELRIICMHHALDYWNINDRRYFKGTIQKECDLILFGHLHELEHIFIPEEGTYYISSGYSYETGKNKIYYNIFTYNYLDNKGSCYTNLYTDKQWLRNHKDLDLNVKKIEYNLITEMSKDIYIDINNKYKLDNILKIKKMQINKKKINVKTYYYNKLSFTKNMILGIQSLEEIIDLVLPACRDILIKDDEYFIPIIRYLNKNYKDEIFNTDLYNKIILSMLVHVIQNIKGDLNV